MCASISQNQLGYVQAETWVGEENAILNLPVIYDAIASSQTVRIFRILKSELLSKLPTEVLKNLENKLWPRLNYLRDRLLEIHETRSEIVKMDKISETLPETHKHMA